MMEWVDAFSQWLLLHVGDAQPWEAYARYLPRIVDGVGVTLKLVIVSGIFGVMLALPVALARLSRHPWLWMPAYGYIFFFRGTPLLVQIFLIYYGLSQFEFLRNTGWFWEEVLSQAYWCAIIAFTLNTAAYTAELMRGAISAVPRGEVEAACALGLSRSMRYRRIILPRAFRIMLPAYSNEVVLMLKGSALASTITILDLMGATRSVIARSYMNMDFFLLAGAFYLLMAAVFIGLFRILEYSLNAHRRMPVAHSAEKTGEGRA